MTWQERALCRGLDTERFYPAEGERDPSRSRREQRAKAICRGCPVAAPCLAEALAHRDRWGVFGGLTAEERAGLQRKQRRTSTTPTIRHVRAGAP
jgi:WhiB family transcriptional regulator, redox-sensing transcriptional regulator